MANNCIGDMLKNVSLVLQKPKVPCLMIVKNSHKAAQNQTKYNN